MIRGSRDLIGDERIALAEACGRALGVLTGAGFVAMEPGQLLAAEDLLDLYGEDVRSRAFVFEGVGGGDLCLRPDLTLAILRHHLQEAGGGPARYAAAGPVFRRPAAGEQRPAQFAQVGCEWFGAEDEPAAEAEVFALMRRALGEIGCQDVSVATGDLGILFSLLDAVEMPERWRARLKRHVWRPERFRAMLHALGEVGVHEAGQSAFLKAVGALDPPQAHAAVERMLSLSETTHVGLRGFDEIAERFLEQAEDARAHPLSEEIIATIEAAVRLRAPCDSALVRLRDLAAAAGVGIGAALSRFERRLEALERAGIKAAELPFDGEFGRNLEYYDGFVFEFFDPSLAETQGRRAAQLAGGGRYGRMIPAAARAFGVSCPTSTAALGAAIRPETALLCAGGKR